jgi:hypothetical protein
VIHRSSSTQASGQLSPDPFRPHWMTSPSHVSPTITPLAGYGASDANETRWMHANQRTTCRKVRQLRDLLMIFPCLKTLQNINKPRLSHSAQWHNRTI